MSLTKRQLLSVGALSGLSAALVLGGGGTASAADTRWTDTGPAQVDTLGSGQGLASRADGTLLHHGLFSVPLDLRDGGRPAEQAEKTFRAVYERLTPLAEDASERLLVLVPVREDQARPKADRDQA